MAKFCPKCGEELVDNAKFCKNCGANLDNIESYTNLNDQGNYGIPVVENDHTAAVIIGYVGAILIPIIGIIAGIYLYTRKDSEKANRHAKFIIILAAVVWILSALLLTR